MNPCVDHCYLRFGKQYTPDCDDKCAYAKAEKELKRFQWTNLKKQLPPKDVLLLVTDGKIVWQDAMIDCGIYGKQEDYCWTSETPFYRITHWMLRPELPAPPEVE